MTCYRMNIILFTLTGVNIGYSRHCIYNIRVTTKVSDKKSLNKYNIVPNPKLGQHFMVDEKYLDKISSQIDKQTTVIEVGPGTGVLTEVLALKAKKVIAIEIDKQFVDCLKQLERSNKNLKVVFGNALSNLVDNLVNQEKRKKESLLVVSNLPYHITEPFIKKLAELEVEAVLTVGKKFGYQARINDPHDPNFTELSYVCRSFFNVKKLYDVSKDAFYPIPKTDSVVLLFTPKSLDKSVNTSSRIGKEIILNQKHGGLIKNVLMNILIRLKKNSNIKITKNESRSIIKELKLDEKLLSKSFGQLNNNEIKSLAQATDTLNS